MKNRDRRILTNAQHKYPFLILIYSSLEIDIVITKTLIIFSDAYLEMYGSILPLINVRNT